MKIPKDGSKWTGGRGDRFHVVSTIELEGHTWVHYIKEDKTESREYSCYVESFLERFRELPE
jgi:hypothetical protein